MAIRVATLEDISTLVEIGRVSHEESRFKRYGYDPVKLAANLKALIEDRTGVRCIFVADDADKRPYGILMGCIESHFFANEPVAQLIYFWVHPAHRRGGSAALKLVTTFRKWAENREAFELSVSINSGVRIDRTDKFFKKLGFKLTGGNYSLSLGS